MAYRCANHPERDAIGICVKCRKYVCSECATKIEGVNYCADCLPGAKKKEARHERSWEKPAAVGVVLMSFFVCSLLIGTCAALLPAASSGDVEEAWMVNYEWLREVERALEGFRDDCGRFPSDSEGLGVLLTNPGAAGWDGPYLDPSQADKWTGVRDAYDTPIRYRISGLSFPVIISAGSDGIFQTDIDSLTESEEADGDDEILWVW